MRNHLLIFLATFSLLFPLAATAQVLQLAAPKSSYRVGDSFSATLSLNTQGRSINTLSGIIDIPQDKLQIVDVRYGNSIVTLWVERPSINYTTGTIAFTGGIPGGYSGSNGPILTFSLKARRTGSATIFLKDVKILLNDGLGTEAQDVTLKNLTLTISEALPTLKPEKKEAVTEPAEEVLPPDTVPPENFTPFVSRHPSVGDNKYFVSFFAVDKDSGIARYEVREESRFLPLFSTEPKGVESPYILQYQQWPSKVSVRAYDQAGNYADAYAEKPMGDELALGLAAGGMVIVGFAVYFAAKRSSRPQPKKEK